MLLSRTFKLCLALGVCFLLALGGCGGGTMGTQTGGNRQVVVSGIVASEGEPLTGAEVVAVDENGDPLASGTTENGQYILEFRIPEDATFFVKVLDPESGQMAEVPVPTGDKAGEYSVNVNFNQDNPPNVEVRPVVTPAPSPEATAKPRETQGASPTSTPTAPVLPTPTHTPTEVSTSTPVSTPTPCTNCDAVDPSPTPTPASDCDSEEGCGTGQSVDDCIASGGVWNIDAATCDGGESTSCKEDGTC